VFLVYARQTAGWRKPAGVILKIVFLVHSLNSIYFMFYFTSLKNRADVPCVRASAHGKVAPGGFITMNWVTFAGLVLTYGMMRLILVCIHSQHAWIQLAGCLVAAAVMANGARVVLNNFYVWIAVKCGLGEEKDPG
jgi:hypothetical protein